MERAGDHELPVSGVVGVLGGGRDTGQDPARLLDAPPATRPNAVELRADLFEDPRRALDALGVLAGRIPVLFTVRLASGGGRFRGRETERLALYEEALSRGAAMVDAEWASDAAVSLAAAGAPLVASHHDFKAMPDAAELGRLTGRMEELGAEVIKVVPSAARQEDGAEMLRWVGSVGDAPPFRVGFAMGPAGLPSRVLSLARGAAWTYGTFGAAVAPGMPSVRELRTEYRAASLDGSTRVFGVLGTLEPASGIARENDNMRNTARLYNRIFHARSVNAVCLPVTVRSLQEIKAAVESLPLGGLAVTLPLQEAAVAVADERGAAVRSCGRTDTLCVLDDGDGRRHLVAHAVLQSPQGAGAARLETRPEEAIRRLVEQFWVLTGLQVSPQEVANFLVGEGGGALGPGTR